MGRGRTRDRNQKARGRDQVGETTGQTRRGTLVGGSKQEGRKLQLWKQGSPDPRGGREEDGPRRQEMMPWP